MSKLLNKYNELKNNDPNKVYIFKIGIFYNILNEDATFIHEKLESVK